MNQNIIIKYIRDVTDINNNYIYDVPNEHKKYYNVYNYCLNITNEQKNKIYNCVSNASEKLKLLPNELKNKNNEISDNIWFIFINDRNVMFDLPYTLNKIIFLPISIVINYNETRLTEILIHERIHILQRYNLNNWFEYISNNLPKWNKLNYCYCNNYLNKIVYPNIVIKNPDIYDYYCYNDGNNNYVAYFIINVNYNKPYLQWFKIKNNDDDGNDSNNHELEKTIFSINDVEHPFEHYAYYFANKLNK